jgi:hypothetical protein
MSDTLMAIVATEAKHAAEREPTLEGKLRAAMKVAANHWMVLDRDVQLKGALAAVLQVVGIESGEGQRIQHELRLHRALSAAASGVPVDFAALLGDEDEPRPEPVRIADLWREATT